MDYENNTVDKDNFYVVCNWYFPQKLALNVAVFSVSVAARACT
jgi:hypothetical protein